ncbi:hypothetical protein ACTFIW_012130, partial [Dictyostelium discoideum]
SQYQSKFNNVGNWGLFNNVGNWGLPYTSV